MNRSRIATALLILAATTALTACGDQDTATTAGSTPPAPTAAAATSADASPTAAPASSVATGAMSDKKLCETVKKASDEMKAEVLKAAMAGEPSAADYKKILTELEQKLTTAASTGGDTKLVAALKEFGAQASKAAAAADPATAADNPAFEKAGKDITAACKAAGISVIF
ncbi:hypothetical protein [Micromonospora sp. NBC_01638]|uniref:hypothetical protein n=1 Tax=Micromonospora sp. NBC_01638 TaxID=2975982 RepID=UPI003866D29B|nr:hypothetical protein OG811_25700 [Micromonospora sp. NBC_01638]